MEGIQLKELLIKHGLTYERFVQEMNTFCRREVISATAGKNVVANWTGGKRNISPAMQFAIEQYFLLRQPL